MASEVFKIVNKHSLEYIQDFVCVKDILLIISGMRGRYRFQESKEQGTASSPFGSRLPGYGTVYQMKSDSQSLILISGD